MCGIAGFCLNPKHHANASELAGAMLYEIEHRGYHATGTAHINPRSGKRVMSKAPMAASQFVPRMGENLCKGAQTAILHTRWATQGSPKNNTNNHPIPRGKIVLTHNGHVSNDNDLFKQLGVKRYGQVDSEAVAALLAFSTHLHPTEILPEVRGTAALAWISENEVDTLHLARVSSSPLWMGQTSYGHLLYGSTEETIQTAADTLQTDLDWVYTAKEGEYFKVKAGKITEYKQFTPAKHTHRIKDWSEYMIEWDKEKV